MPLPGGGSLGGTFRDVVQVTQKQIQNSILERKSNVNICIRIEKIQPPRI